MKRSLAVAQVACSLAATLVAAPSFAQAIPGGARGSQTGDGGGAYAGVASSPNANPFTGAAQTSIPIEVPPGRLGFAPTLALAYSSAAGPSAYGYGWSLALPRIHRSTRRGLPRFDQNDTFVLEMPGAAVDLVAVEEKPGAYRAEVEAAFLRIGFDRGANTWIVVDKSGAKFRFAAAQARVASRFAPDDTFAWMLTSAEDPAGNRIEYEYRPEPTTGTWSPLPDRILYGENRKARLAHFAEVRFGWETATYPTSPPVSFRNGFAERLDARLTTIETFTHGERARRYDFSHQSAAASGDDLLVGVTLTAFADDAEDDVRLPSTVFLYAPPVAAGWDTEPAGAPGDVSFEVPEVGPLRRGTLTVTTDTLDVDGDGIVDHVSTDTWPPRVRLGNGRGFAPPVGWNWPSQGSAPRFVRKGDANGNLVVNLFDLDGDAFADLVSARIEDCGASAGHWCVWRGSAAGFADGATLWRAPVDRLRRTSRSGSRVDVDLVDIDGDGRLDLVDTSAFDANASSPHWQVHRNLGDRFATTPSRYLAPLPHLARTAQGRLLYGLFDINADSLPDLVVASEENVDAWDSWAARPYWSVYYGGDGGLSREAAEWTVEGGQMPLPDFLTRHAEDGSTTADLLDVTGDGRPDLLRRNRVSDYQTTGIDYACDARQRCAYVYGEESGVSPASCCYQLLVYVNTGSSFAPPAAWTSPAHGLRVGNESCPYTTSTCLRNWLFDYDIFDFDGDGLVDFVERYGFADRATTWRVHPHPSALGDGNDGGPAPAHLLVAMRNGVGGDTMLRYRPAAATPDTRLPFPHWVVSERILGDSIFQAPPLRTSFAYRGGLYESLAREMRGFAEMARTDPTGVVEVFHFHQDRRRAGRVQRSMTAVPPVCAQGEAGDPAVSCSLTDFALGEERFEWSPQGPVLLQSQTSVPFHRGSPVEALRRTTSYEYDDLGNVVRRRVETPLAHATDTTTTYERRVRDRGSLPDEYSVQKPTHVVLREEGRALPLLERRFVYDWTAGVYGSLLESSTCVAWSGSDCRRWSTRRFAYDTAGNPVTATAADGGTSRTDYDANALFAVRSVDPSGLATEARQDPRTGAAVHTVTPSGLELFSRYDGLGRLLRTWGPGTSEDDPLKTVEYGPGALAADRPRTLTREKGRAPSSLFFDGLGRVAAVKTLAETDAGLVARVASLKRYDDRGLVVAEALPFDSSATEVGTLAEAFADARAWLAYEYDDAGRLVATVAPDGSTTRMDRSAPGILLTEDANSVSASYPGATTIELFDGLGRRLQRDVCSAAPPAAAPYDCREGTLEQRQTWTYDAMDRVIESRTHSLGRAAGDSIRRVDYDGQGSRRSVEQSDAGRWLFEHDDVGRVTAVHKPDGATISTEYDESGRILRRRAGRESATYRYSRSGRSAGKIRRVASKSESTRTVRDYRYDPRGRLRCERTRIARRRGQTIRSERCYDYDDLDRRVATEYRDWPDADSAVVRTAFDDFGREIGLASDRRTYVERSTYDSGDRLVRIDFGNGVSDRIGFEEADNAAGQVATLRCIRTARSARGGDACSFEPGDLDGLHHAAHDLGGNLLRLDDPLAEFDPSRPSVARRYEYDAMGRLVRSTGEDGVETFVHDPIGNLVRAGAVELVHDDPSRPGTLTSARIPGGPDRLFSYDDAGHRQTDGAMVLAYDDFDRLVAVQRDGEVVAEFGYDDSGRRVFRGDLRPEETSFEVGDDLRVLADGSMERVLSLGGRPVAVERTPSARARAAGAAPEVSFLHLDHQASVRLATGADGRVLERSSYGPFGALRWRRDGSGRETGDASGALGFTGQREEAAAGLLYFGSRYYDPATASFLTLDPEMQFASPYAYAGGNPVLGRDPDGRFFGLTPLEIVVVLTGSAAFVDTLVRSGDLGQALTATGFASFSAYGSYQLSTLASRQFSRVLSPTMQQVVSVATSGIQAAGVAEALDDGRVAGGIVAAGMLAASLIGIESAGDDGAGDTPAERYARHGIHDRGVIDGKRVIDVDGICGTRPGCVTNFFVALRENVRTLFGKDVACVGGCEEVEEIALDALDADGAVLLRCNSFGATKCLGALQRGGLTVRQAASASTPQTVDGLSVHLSGAPILRPPRIDGVTYQANLFDPVVWVGTVYSVPLRSDVVLGRNWWVPAPLVVHHGSMYDKPFFDALGDLVP